MGIEWFRDLSIVILAFVTTAMLIFTAVLVYRLYRMVKSTLLLAKEASKIARDSAAMLQESMKPLLPIIAVIQGIQGGFEVFRKMFKKESNAGGGTNE